MVFCSRRVRNRVELLMFAIENDDEERTKFYKKELFQFVQQHKQFVKIHIPPCMRECFRKLQDIRPRRFYRLFIEIMRGTAVKFRIDSYTRMTPLDRVPIYIACVGAKIEKFEPELLDEYLDTGHYDTLKVYVLS